MNPNPWRNESGFLTDAAKRLIENRATLPDDALITIWRELDAVTRLLYGELFLTGKPQGVCRVALACEVSYGQTPISQHGYIPPAEVSMKLSCGLVEDQRKAEKLAKAEKVAETVEVDLADFN